MHKSNSEYRKPRPTLNEPTSNDIGKKGEKRTNRILGSVLTPGSGSGRTKGDMLHGFSRTGRHRPRGYRRMIEKKSTKYNSIRLQKSWLEKLEKQAFDAGKEPVLIIEFETMTFGSTQWGLIPLSKLKELFELEDTTD